MAEKRDKLRLEIRSRTTFLRTLPALARDTQSRTTHSRITQQRQFNQKLKLGI